MADSSKTEKATPKKRRDERKKGNVFKSQDAVAVATLVGTFAMLIVMKDSFVEELSGFFSYCAGLIDQPGIRLEGILSGILMKGVMAVVKTVGPVMLVGILCAVVATFGQTRFLVTGQQLKPKFSRISPMQGFKRLFSLRSVIEALKGILKIALLMILVYMSLKDMFDESSKYLYTDVSVAAAHLVDCVQSMIWKIILAFVAIAAFDYMYQRWDYERQMRMSKQEIKEEYKQTEGDPQVKGKIKEIQRRRAQQRMMQQVPQADVVIRNPTHYAVALRYKPERDNAPVVLAKGRDELALRIVRVAEEHGIAVMENIPLAHALYEQAELDREIPPELYGPVADVLVYIFRLDERAQIVK